MEMRTAGYLAFCLGALVATGCTTASYGSSATAVGPGATLGGDRKSGAGVFAQNCASCHGAQGSGGGVGPSLRDESRRMDFGTLVSWIEDPEPPMPRLFPGQLTKRQVRDVAAYVLSL